jgi:hypothetical protein
MAGLIFDLVDMQELQGFVRATVDEVTNNRFGLAQFLPNQDIDDIEFQAFLGERLDEDVAKVTTWDVEAPIGKRQGVSKIMGQLPPIKKKWRVNEEERYKLRRLQGGNNQPIIDQIYNDTFKGGRAIAARLEQLRGEALHKGMLEIRDYDADSGVGVNQDVDFERRADFSGVAPATLWSDNTNATPVFDEQAWMEDYEDENDILPAFALTSRKVVNHLALNAQYRSLAQANGIVPAVLGLAQINAVRAVYNLPPIVTYETKVKVDGVSTRVIPEADFIYLPPAAEPLGKTFFGPTPEALELAESQQIAAEDVIGATAVVSKTDDPVATWTKVTAVGLPILINPNLTMQAEVI